MYLVLLGINTHFYSGADVQNFQYTYDKLGNILTRDDYSIQNKGDKRQGCYEYRVTFEDRYYL